ncbi:MAG: transposase, partial [Thermodesulfovibrionales bacterium]|nr:transposase [Thermodesulfovibrionales bacterium]
MANRLCMGDLLSGLSMRNYEAVAERFLEGYGIKKSSISRRYIRATKEKMQELLERDLKGLDIRVLFIDGIERQGHLLVVAIGIDSSGKKHVLGLWQGATENLEVCLGLLDDLERRGLDMNKNYLSVLDGSRALRSAVARKFGRRALVQRCQVHKRKNVKSYLPPEHQASIDARVRAAYNMANYEDAKEALEKTIKYLEMLNPSAAASLKEGLEETLMIHKLGISGQLRKTLSSTNVIESSFSLVGSAMDRVRKWHDALMVHRWAAVSLLEAEKRFKKVKGYREMPKLITAIDREVAKKGLTTLEEVA